MQVSGPVPGANTTFTYDGYGRRRTSTDATGLTLTYDYDALDRVTKVSYPDSTYEETVYKWLDAEKRRNATSWEYDLEGRVTKETRADTSSESYTYETTTSRLKQKTDRKNVTTTFEYFLDSKVKRKSYSDTTPAASYTYVDGQMLTAANGTDTLTWTYDNKDRVATEGSAKNASMVGYTSWKGRPTHLPDWLNEELDRIVDKMDSESCTLGGTPPDDRCKLVRVKCIDECNGFVGFGPRWNQGTPFFDCVGRCMERNGC